MPGGFGNSLQLIGWLQATRTNACRGTMLLRKRMWDSDPADGIVFKPILFRPATAIDIPNNQTGATIAVGQVVVAKKADGTEAIGYIGTDNKWYLSADGPDTDISSTIAEWRAPTAGFNGPTT